MSTCPSSRRDNDELVLTADDLGFGMVTWSPLDLGLLSSQFCESLPKGARLTLDRDTWLSGILTEGSIKIVYRLNLIAGGSFGWLILGKW